MMKSLPIGVVLLPLAIALVLAACGGDSAEIVEYEVDLAGEPLVLPTTRSDMRVVARDEVLGSALVASDAGLDWNVAVISEGYYSTSEQLSDSGSEGHGQHRVRCVDGVEYLILGGYDEIFEDTRWPSIHLPRDENSLNITLTGDVARDANEELERALTALIDRFVDRYGGRVGCESSEDNYDFAFLRSD